MTDRYDSLSPRDLIVTLRSLPRRFDQVHAGATRTEDLVALIDSAGPDGSSLSSLVNDAAQTMTVLGSAISSVTKSNTPSVNAQVLKASDRLESDGPPKSVKNAVALLSGDAEALADQLDGISADDWARNVDITGDGSIQTVALVQELVRAMIDLLRSAEQQVEWMQSQQ